jgi:hypothetical protein
MLQRKPSLVEAYVAQMGDGPKSMVTTAPLAACGLRQGGHW